MVFTIVKRKNSKIIKQGILAYFGMSNTKLHERLLELTLFQGMSRNDLEQIISATKFRQLDYGKNKIVANDGDVCNKFFFLIEGTISATGHSDDNGYSITELVQSPEVLQPERIFGLTQRYTKTFKTVTDCTFISLSKMEALELASKYEIFRLNLLNIVCTKSQRLTRSPWRVQPKDIRHKIARFVETRCVRPAGEKIIKIKMERLGNEINESRLNTSHELNAMEAEGILTLRRGEIHIHALEKIILT